MAYRADGSGAAVTLVVPPSAVRPHPSPTPTSVISNPRPHLPFTGFDAGTAALLAVLLVVLGALLLVRGRTGLPHSPRRT